MWLRLRTFWTPPVFSDREKTRRASLLNAILLAILIGTALFTLTLPLLAPAQIFQLVAALPILPLVGGVRWLMRRGQVQFASLLFLAATWMIVTLAAFAWGGVRSVAFNGYILLIPLASVLLGGRAGLAVAGLSTLAGLGLAYAEIKHVLPSSFNTPLSLWGVGAIICFLAAAIFWLVVNDLGAALRHAERELIERQQVEAALRASEDFRRLIIESDPECIKLVAPNGTLLEMNRAGLDMLEAESLQQVKGLPVIGIVAQESRAAYIHLHQRVVRGESGALEFEIIGLRGTRRWLETHEVPLRNEQQQVVALLGVTRDITERKRAGMERQVLLEIMQGAMITADLQEFLRFVHTSIAKVIEAENFFVSLYDRETGLIGDVYSVDQYDQPAPPQKPGKTTSAYVFRTGQPLLLTQEQFDTLAAQGEVELVGTNSPSWLGVPLKTPEETIGVMVVQDYEQPDRYSARDVEFFASVAGQVAQAIERKRTEEALLRFREVMDESPEAVFFINPETSQYIDFNKTALEFLGYNREELLQLGVIHIAQHVKTLEGWHERTALVQENDGVAFETVYQRKDGTQFPVELSARTLGDGEKAIMIAVVRDITERKQAEETLRENEERFRSLVENLPIGVYRTTPGLQGRFLMANPAFVSMFGYDSEEEVKAAAVADFYVNPDERKIFSDNLVAKGGVTGVQLHLQKRNGTSVWSSVTAKVIYTDNDRISHFDCTVEDITERKWAEEEIKRRAHEFAALYGIARDLSIQWNLPRLLETIVDQTMELFQVSGSGIYLYDPTRGDLPIVIDRGPGFLPDIRLALGEGLAGRVAQTQQPLNVDDYQTWEGRSLQYEGVPVRATAAVPLLYSGELIGVLVVEEVGASTRRFTKQEVQFLSLLAAQAASAVHNARLFEATRRRLTEMEAVSRVSTIVRAAQTLDMMLPPLLDEILSVLNTETGSIVLYDPNHRTLFPAVRRGWFTAQDQSPMQPSEGVAGYVFTSGEVYRSAEFAAEARARVSVRAQIPLGWGGVCVPIRTAQENVGVIFVAVQLPHELTDDEVRLLTTLVEIAGNAIHRTRLNEETDRNLRRLAALHTIDLAISSSFDLKVSLNILLEQTMFHLNADAVAVLRLNPYLQMLEYAASRGFYTPLITKARLQIGQPYAGQAVMERRLISIPDFSQVEPAFTNPAFTTTEDLQAYHAVPLIAKGQVKGVLEVYHRKPFQPNPDWLNFLQTLGGQAAIAIDNAELFDGLQRSNMELVLAYDATIEGWSRALDLRDEETEYHTQRVTEMTTRLAQTVGISQGEMIHLRRGALLHDIGKMGVPDKILLKPSSLTDEEWVIMRRHPEYAYEMLVRIDYLRPALDIPYCHHEKWDGTGYPRGLKGEQIPLAARIFTVVDVWDALRSDRHYRKAWPEKEVRAYIRAESGAYFDPRVAEAFLQMLQRDEVTVESAD